MKLRLNFYTSHIKGHPGWELAGIYADDGITGTNTKKREEFNRMIDECMAGHINMVIIKSISRFAQNKLDCFKYIRQLKDKNIPVYFEKRLRYSRKLDTPGFFNTVRSLWCLVSV